MLIGLISDTHIPEAGKELPPQVYKAFRGVELILHAGDMHVIEVLDCLEQIAPVLAARGNGDHVYSSMPNRPGVPEDPRVKEVHIIPVGGLTIGLTHDFPLPEEVITPHDKLMDILLGTRTDVIVCGHSHIQLVRKINGTLIVNPGSPTLPWGRFELGTVGLLEMANGEAIARIVDLKSL